MHGLVAAADHVQPGQGTGLAIGGGPGVERFVRVEVAVVQRHYRAAEGAIEPVEVVEQIAPMGFEEGVEQRHVIGRLAHEHQRHL